MWVYMDAKIGKSAEDMSKQEMQKSILDETKTRYGVKECYLCLKIGLRQINSYNLILKTEKYICLHDKDRFIGKEKDGSLILTKTKDRVK